MSASEVEWVLVIRYGKTDHARIYGRLGEGTYTGDYIQLTDAVLDDLEKVFPDFAGGVNAIPLTYKWPSGAQQGNLVRESADRPHLKWNYNEAPAPWKMGLKPTASTVETIPGDPSHDNASQADLEFSNLELSGFGQPFLLAVKLKDEDNTLHLRVAVENPTAGFEWADLQNAPIEIRELAAKTNGSRRKAWRFFSKDESVSPLFFDPAKKAEPWSSSGSSSLGTSGTPGATTGVSAPSPIYDDLIAETLEATEEEVSKFEESIEAEEYEVPDVEGTSKTRGSAQRAFSKAVKENYDWKCALTGISSKEFLIASHIVPWSVDKTIRLDPSNGICLSVLVDRAFENGFLLIQDDLTVIIDWAKVDGDLELKKQLEGYDGAKLAKPKLQTPRAEYLKRRRDL